MERDSSDETRWREWMVAAQAGDHDAYDRLLHSLGDAIDAYLRARFGAMNFIEDCVQECLLAIHQARHTYDPSRPFRPWLFTLVRHKAIDMLRRMKRQLTVDMPANVEATTADPTDALATGQVLDALSPQFREALALTKIAGLTVTGAARQCGVSESAMKARVNRALKAVRKNFEREVTHGQ